MLHVVDIGGSHRYKFDYNAEIHIIKREDIAAKFLGMLTTLLKPELNSGEPQPSHLAQPRLSLGTAALVRPLDARRYALLKIGTFQLPPSATKISFNINSSCTGGLLPVLSPDGVSAHRSERISSKR
jgi:hypothetical protein